MTYSHTRVYGPRAHIAVSQPRFPQYCPPFPRDDESVRWTLYVRKYVPEEGEGEHGSNG